MFNLVKKFETSNKRVGELITRRGAIPTPVFMPIATKGAVKSVLPDEMENLGSKLILGNTYHLWLRPGVEVIKKASLLRPAQGGASEGQGGLHKFMNWPHSILTDSGGYQVFSLGERVRLKGSLDFSKEAQKGSENNFQKRKIFPGVENFTRQFSSLVFPRDRKDSMPARRIERFENHVSEPFLSGSNGFVKISDRGVEFRDPIDGNKYFLTPEKSIGIQLDLGSDIIMVLDECPPYPASRDQVEKAIKRTAEWAGRCKKYFDHYCHCEEFATKQSRNITSAGASSEDDVYNSGLLRPDAGLAMTGVNRPLLFGIIQGGIYEDLRKQSAREILEIGFDGYAIRGVAVGEPRESLKDILNWVVPILPQDKPRYLMGLGKPEEIVAAVNAGIDMFDCVIPTREARHGRIYKFKKGGRVLEEKIFYETLQIDRKDFEKDFLPIDEECSCRTCRNFSRAYLRHLFRVGEPLSLTLATIHNLKFYFELMEKLKI